MESELNSFRIFAHGEAFDVDAFLASTQLPVDRSWRHGDPLPGARYGVDVHPNFGYKSNGVAVNLGDGRTLSLKQQEQIATAFLTKYGDELRSLGRFPGIGAFIIGIQLRAPVSPGEGFSVGPSPQLMRESLSVGVELVYYIEIEVPSRHR